MTAEPNSLSYSALPADAVLNGSYRIISVLGAGGFGITYLAWDTIRERHVVIKECLPGDYALRENQSYHIRPISDETAHMFYDCLTNARQEAETLAQFSYPGVVKIYDLFEENGTFYYVMEYIEGQTLHDYMLALREQGQLIPADQAEGLLVYVLDILQHLHDQKIYHCDIKPGNIFIMPDGMPKLIDFGAVRSKELQHQGLVQITPGYTPPEFYPGSLRELGPWSDIYELGATFYELLTGNVPEPSDKRVKVDRMVKISSIDSLRTRYPLVFLSSIDKALSPDHNNRFKTAQLWTEYIDSYGAGRQLQTVNPHSHVASRLRAAGMPVIHKKKKKSNAGFVVTVLLLLVLVGVGVGIRNGKIDIDRYPELSFIKDFLGVPPKEDEKTEQQDDSTETPTASPSGVTDDAPAPSTESSASEKAGDEQPPAPGLKLIEEATEG